MDAEAINVLRDLFEEFLGQESSTVIAAYLTVGGMLCVSIVGVISQWLITKRIVAEEHKRLLVQLHTESLKRQHEKWEEDILESVMELLKATDPDINSKFDRAKIAAHVLKVQLLLNTEDPNQDQVNRLSNQLALTASGWIEENDTQPIFTLHGQLLEVARLLIYRPTNNA